jgi:hypothetical protein
MKLPYVCVCACRRVPPPVLVDQILRKLVWTLFHWTPQQHHTFGFLVVSNENIAEDSDFLLHFVYGDN